MRGFLEINIYKFSIHRVLKESLSNYGQNETIVNFSLLNCSITILVDLALLLRVFLSKLAQLDDVIIRVMST